ncbi:MAG: hypothetical protein NTY47_00760, partial [Candidatus Omnitrophica bacterium]|nr:hypothetical protein [Candidatus Omnitrophota bacterium]
MVILAARAYWPQISGFLAAYSDHLLYASLPLIWCVGTVDASKGARSKETFRKKLVGMRNPGIRRLIVRLDAEGLRRLLPDQEEVILYTLISFLYVRDDANFHEKSGQLISQLGLIEVCKAVIRKEVLGNQSRWRRDKIHHDVAQNI